MSDTTRKKRNPLNITFDEPTVQVNRRTFERIKYLYNKLCTVEEEAEYTGLIHLLFHTHGKEGDK